MLSVRHAITTVLTPAARRMSAVSPNALTLVSLGSGVLAGLAFAMAAHGRGWYAAAGLLVAASGSADALDGLVARLHGRVSTAGEFFDHFGDRLVEVAILAGIAVTPGAHTTFGLAVVILTLLSSYLGTQIQATFGRRSYSGLGKAEQFLGLVVYAVVMTVFPGLIVPLGGLRLSAADVVLVLLGAGAVAGLVHRARFAWTLCSATRPLPPEDGRP